MEYLEFFVDNLGVMFAISLFLLVLCSFLDKDV